MVALGGKKRGTNKRDGALGSALPCRVPIIENKDNGEGSRQRGGRQWRKTRNILAAVNLILHFSSLRCATGEYTTMVARQKAIGINGMPYTTPGVYQYRSVPPGCVPNKMGETYHTQKKKNEFSRKHISQPRMTGNNNSTSVFRLRTRVRQRDCRLYLYGPSPNDHRL